MTSNPLISVIVPIFKVQDYLSRCIDSIINQTYTNLEIILVDDGSPDLCPQICDEYAKRDSRIKVIHKDNGGASSARNAGLDICTGKYVSFIDSDDFIEKELYSIAIPILEMNNSIDILQFNIIWRSAKRNSVSPLFNEVSKDHLFSSYDALCYMLQCQMITGYVANKIYRFSNIGNTRFVMALNSEDFIFNYQVIKKAENIFCIKEKLYNYVTRNESLSFGEITNSSVYTFYYLEEEQNRIIDKKLNDCWKAYIIQYSLIMYDRLLTNKEFKFDNNIVRNSIRKNFFQLRKHSLLSIKKRIMIVVLIINKKLYNALWGS